MAANSISTRLPFDVATAIAFLLLYVQHGPQCCAHAFTPGDSTRFERLQPWIHATAGRRRPMRMASTCNTLRPSSSSSSSKETVTSKMATLRRNTILCRCKCRYPRATHSHSNTRPILKLPYRVPKRRRNTSKCLPRCTLRSSTNRNRNSNSNSNKRSSSSSTNYPRRICPLRNLARNLRL